MNTVSRSVPSLPALLNNRPSIANFSAWLQILKERLRVGWEREYLRTLDKRVNEDLGLVSSDWLELPTGEAPKKLSGPLRQVFSWTRFSK